MWPVTVDDRLFGYLGSGRSTVSRPGVRGARALATPVGSSAVSRSVVRRFEVPPTLVDIGHQKARGANTERHPGCVDAIASCDCPPSRQRQSYRSEGHDRAPDRGQDLDKIVIVNEGIDYKACQEENIKGMAVSLQFPDDRHHCDAKDKPEKPDTREGRARIA